MYYHLDRTSKRRAPNFEVLLDDQLVTQGSLVINACSVSVVYRKINSARVAISVSSVRVSLNLADVAAGFVLDGLSWEFTPGYFPQVVSPTYAKRNQFIHSAGITVVVMCCNGTFSCH